MEETAHSGIFICEDKVFPLFCYLFLFFYLESSFFPPSSPLINFNKKRTKLLCRVKAVRKGILDATDLENLSFYSNSFVSFRKKGGKLLKEKEVWNL